MRVAVVGSGSAGLGATWLLNQHSEHEVHLYESDKRIGGHVNTVLYPHPSHQNSSSQDADPVPVDTGFIVFNPTTYPNFIRFCRDVAKVPFTETDMSFSVSRDHGAYEWAGHGLGSFFAQPKNLLDPNQWLLLWDIIRFNTEAVDYLTKTVEGQVEEESIQAYLDKHHYSQTFRDNYLFPMTAAVWSTPPDTAAFSFPARTLIQFLHNHHLLQLTGKPAWLTLKNGSRSYVQAIVDALPPNQLHLRHGVEQVRVRSEDGKVAVRSSTGHEDLFDRVILATHADTARQLLGDGATADERELLGKFEFGKNKAVLHSDVTMMPQRQSCWSAWNYLTFTDAQTGKPNVNKVSLTYCMNLLQHIPQDKYGSVLVTLNPPSPVKPDTIVGEYDYEHPYFSTEAVMAQEQLHKIQNRRGLSFCGAWTRYGFHEDGFTSGLKRAVELGAQPPFEVETASRALKEHQIPQWAKNAVSMGEQVRRTIGGWWWGSSSSGSHAGHDSKKQL